MLQLIAFYDHEEEAFAVPEGEAYLGSTPENDITLYMKGVSRRHALLRPVPGGVEIVDLGSKNGLLVAGQRVARTTLTPGLRMQIGAAWIELREASSSEAKLALLSRSRSEDSPLLPTRTVKPGQDPRKLAPAESALLLAYLIAEVGVGTPGVRADLLARIRTALGAEVFASFELRPRGGLRILESEGAFRGEDLQSLRSLADAVRAGGYDRLSLKRAGRLLLAGRDPWFVSARFKEESSARNGCRKEFLRFLAQEFFPPVQGLEELASAETQRVVALAGGQKRRAARWLGISPGTLYKLLFPGGRAKR